MTSSQKILLLGGAGLHLENLCPKPNAIGKACIQLWPVRGGPGLQFASWTKGSVFPQNSCETGCQGLVLQQPL